MGNIEFWRVAVSLGVPGLALAVFYMLFRTFNWKFPQVPAKWVTAIVVLFMLLTTGVTLVALYLWAPPKSAAATQTKILIPVLKARAVLIATKMQDDHARLTAKYRPNDVQMPGLILDDERVLNELAAIREVFQSLHQQHIEALQNGQTAVAHEIASDIHELLHHRYMTLDSALTPPGRYFKTFPSPGDFAEEYPGGAVANVSPQVNDLVFANYPAYPYWSQYGIAFDNPGQEKLQKMIDERRLPTETEKLLEKISHSIRDRAFGKQR